MVNSTIKRQNSGLPHLESIERFGSIPIVESGLKKAENVYEKIKKSNPLFNWYFDTTEATIFSAIDSVQPAVRIFESHIKRFDEIMCKSLDLIEQRVPLVYLPPEMMYWNTKEYMQDHLVKPVLKRADSMKQLTTVVQQLNSVLYAADKVDNAIAFADKYVDRYLPTNYQSQDQVDASSDTQTEMKEIGPIKAIHHGQRFSKKLKRRLTERTILEAQALKKQSKEAIHILIYVAELMIKDPKLALEKAKELWIYLSGNEPENQARPQTLEQLILLLTRESARRIVHLINYTSQLAVDVPKSLLNSTVEVVHQFICVGDYLGDIIKVTEIKSKTIEGAEGVKVKITKSYDEMEAYANNALERLAIFLSGRIEAEKISTNTPRRRMHTQNIHRTLNGVY